MTANIERARSTAVARPLKVLVPLIKDELDAGNAAGIEHYRKAGEMLLEAKEQVGHGEWQAWVERHFTLSAATARHYMKLAEAVKTKPGFVFDTVRQAARPNAPTYGPRWNEPVKQIVSRVNTEALAQDRQNREKEDRLLRQLGTQLIDIGYKVLAATLHPDKGGSPEAMARLNKVRSILKDAV